METEARVPGQPGLSAKPCLKGWNNKSSLVSYSNPAKRTFKKARLQVQQYTAITDHSSRREIRVTPRCCTMRGWTQGLRHSRKTVTETYPQSFWLVFCLVGWLVGFLSQDLTQLARLPLKPWICQPPASTSWEHRPILSGPTFQLVFNHGLIKPVSNIPLHKHEAQTATKQERVAPLNTSYYTSNASSFPSEGAKNYTIFVGFFFLQFFEVLRWISASHQSNKSITTS